MKFLFFFILMTIFQSCGEISVSEAKKDEQFPERNLPHIEREKTFNLLILFDLDTTYQKSMIEWDQNIQYFLWKLHEDFNFNVAISEIDNRYQFLYATNNERLIPKKFTQPVGDLKSIQLGSLIQSPEKKAPGLLYTLNKLKFLASSKFFNKDLDTIVVVVSAQDDYDYYVTMDGVIKKDHFQSRIDELNSLNQEIHLPDLRKIQYYTFKQMRLFTLAPHNAYCSGSLNKYYRYRLASKEVYTHYKNPNPRETWPDYYNFCHRGLQSIFNDIFREIKTRL
ncbi:MAG: hypothetical protein H6621_01885 [Halobacteriovoraceae bacterium]|nr:hypothetical protein [Halobacteriovoraceae bacterium]MCB9093792.1 hypothetical protein [Halobacteriovoraceae bacterium]